MRLSRNMFASTGIWWQTISLFVTLPAVILAVLALRAVRADRIERNQQIRDRHIQTTRLADAGIRAVLSDFARELRLGDGGPAAHSVSGLRLFSFDRERGIVFPSDRAYSGNPPEAARAKWPANIEQNVEAALAAEAQHRASQAMDLYNRIASAEPRLRDWARLCSIRLQHADLYSFLTEISSPNHESAGLTPGGIAVPLVACADIEALAVEHRCRYKPVLEGLLASLRQGRWWLSLEQRRFYDKELRSLMIGCVAESGVEASLDPGQELREMANIAMLINSAPLRRDEPTYLFRRTDIGATLLLFSPDQHRTNLWQGAALGDEALQQTLETIIRQSGGHDLNRLLIIDNADQPIWGSGAATGVQRTNEVLTSVPEWRLSFQADGDAGWFDQRTLLWIGFVAILVATMLASLAGTTHIARREADLARLQNDFIAGVSHEFKSPMTSVRLLVERMTGAERLLPESAAEYRTAVEREMSRLEGYVDNLLEAQKIQAGQRHFELAAASVDELAADAIAQVRPLADDKQIAISFDSDPDLPAVAVDKEAIIGAMANLIGNAIKYSMPGTRVAIFARLDRGRVSVDVRDQGIGIAPKEIRKIFSRFYRGVSVSGQAASGSGLGLSLVKATVEQHAGTIRVNSTPGEGSCFTITLPAAR